MVRLLSYIFRLLIFWRFDQFVTGRNDSHIRLAANFDLVMAGCRQESECSCVDFLSLRKQLVPGLNVLPFHPDVFPGLNFVRAYYTIFVRIYFATLLHDNSISTLGYG